MRRKLACQCNTLPRFHSRYFLGFIAAVLLLCGMFQVCVCSSSVALYHDGDRVTSMRRCLGKRKRRRNHPRPHRLRYVSPVWKQKTEKLLETGRCTLLVRARHAVSRAAFSVQVDATETCTLLTSMGAGTNVAGQHALVRYLWCRPRACSCWAIEASVTCGDSMFHCTGTSRGCRQGGPQGR